MYSTYMASHNKIKTGSWHVDIWSK